MTFDEKNEKAASVAREMANLVNGSCGEDAGEVFVETLMRQHKLLQQYVFDNMFLRLVQTVVNRGRNWTDARNEIMYEMCVKIFEALKDMGMAGEFGGRKYICGVRESGMTEDEIMDYACGE